MDRITQAQKYLKEAKIDGWLLYYFDKNNPLALDFLKLDKNAHITRRFFYWIPQQGTPIKIIHTIEPYLLDHLPGEKKTYHAKEQLDAVLNNLFFNKKMRIAMEYSHEGALPYISKVDAGVVEKIRELGPTIVSSAPFLQYFTCTLTDKQQKMQQEAGTFLDQAASKAFSMMKIAQAEDKKISEIQLQQFLLDVYEKEGFYADFPPTIAFGEHTSDPHYMPSIENPTYLQKNQIILIDCVAKKKEEDAVYADITRMAFSGKIIPSKIVEAFDLILEAQGKTFDFIEQRLKKEKTILGYEADQVCRAIIEKQHMGMYFTHRTGHNLFDKVHGPGAHLDGFETFDDRPLIPLTSFTIEPGLYFPKEFGVRVEYDVFIEKNRSLKIISGIQKEIFTF